MAEGSFSGVGEVGHVPAEISVLEGPASDEILYEPMALRED